MTFRQPEKLEINSEPAETWKKWRQNFELYYDAADIGSKPKKQQKAILLHIMGEAGVQIYKGLNVMETGEESEPIVEIILEAFDKYFEPYRNVTFKRHVFRLTTQTSEQGIDQFIAELREKAEGCEFESLKDSLIKDQLISGLREPNLRERLLRIKDLTLAEAIDICRVDEISRIHNRSMKETKELDAINKWNKGSKSRPQTQDRNRDAYGDENRGKRKCSRCLTEHRPGNCPAYGKTCYTCGKINHFKTACRRNQRKVDAISEDEGEWFSISMLSVDNIKLEKEDWYEEIEINQMRCNFKLDSGSQVNILPYNIYKKFRNPPKLAREGGPIMSYSKHELKVEGNCKITCKTKHNKEKVYIFYVVDTANPPILGRRACVELNLITRVDMLGPPSDMENRQLDEIIKQYSDVFGGLGKLANKHHINIKHNIKPKIYMPRRIPIALKDQVKRELEEMETLKIIKKAEGPTEWVHPMVIQKKPNGKLRICIDSRELNKTVMREHLQLPTVDNIMAQIGESKYFTVLDVAKAFHQIELDDESIKLCTFGTPYGRFQFQRLPFGVKSAPEIFQNRINQILGGMPGVEIYCDDILIHTTTEKEHNILVQQVLQKARENNLKLDPKKMQLGKKEVKYLGQCISGEGKQITPSRIESIKKLNKPTDKSSLQRYLGTINYLTRFLPNVATKTEYLKQLLRGKTEWSWDEQCDRDFEDLKTLVTTAPVLKHYMPNKHITLSADASPYGVGAVMMQKEGPIAYASAALTKVQRNYSHIEKELLALVYACEKFHYFIYGKDITVETDHKPLVSIVHKQMEQLSPRIQRMVMRLQRYQANVVYKPGKQQFVADTLSRDPNLEELIDTEYLEGESQSIHMMVSATEDRINQIRLSTIQDKQLTKVMKYIKAGWPKLIKETSQEVRRYWQYREELHQSNDLIFRGNRLVIPEKERDNILSKLHGSHMGIVACKDKARETIFWPGMTADIEKKIKGCKTCQEMARANLREPLLPHEVVTRPWEKIGIDFFKIEKTNYILVTDYHSKYVEVKKLERTTAPPVIDFLKSISARHGIPNILMSDNGPPFDSRVFKEFCKEWDIEHVTSSPKYAKSNGMVERANQTIKNGLKKAYKEKIDPYIVLLNQRTTPHNGLQSPAELLMGRRIRSLLPITKELLEPKYDTQQTNERLEEIQNRQKEYADRGTKSLEQIKEGEKILYEKDKRDWRIGKVLEVDKTPRSYTIKSEGATYRRNRQQLRRYKEDEKKGQIKEEETVKEANRVKGGEIEMTREEEPIKRSRCGREIKIPSRYRQ